MMKTTARRALCLTAALCLALALALPARAVPAEGYYTYILDGAGLLTEDQADRLEALAASITDTYGFAPHLVTLDTLNGVDANDMALAIYDEYDMGYGDQDEGSILLLSMEGRDFAYELWDYTNAVFDGYRRDSVQEAFLAEFRYDNWYDGFYAYLSATEHYLSGAADDVEPGEDYNYYGDYVPDYGRYEEHSKGSPLGWAVFCLGVPALISLFICLGLLSRMKTVRQAAYAGSYVKDGIHLRVKEDVFTHRTETRTKISRSSDSSSSGGGGSGGGGGGHFSSSGKF